MDESERESLVKKARQDGQEKQLRVFLTDVLKENNLSIHSNPSLIKDLANRSRQKSREDSKNECLKIGNMSEFEADLNLIFFSGQGSVPGTCSITSNDSLYEIYLKISANKDRPRNVDGDVTSYHLDRAKNIKNLQPESMKNHVMRNKLLVRSMTKPSQSKFNHNKQDFLTPYAVKEQELEDRYEKKKAQLEDHYSRKLIECEENYRRKLQVFEASERVKSEKIIQDNKRKRWCHVCYNEAKFYCCYRAHYCGSSCRDSDWHRHMPLHVRMWQIKRFSAKYFVKLPSNDKKITRQDTLSLTDSVNSLKELTFYKDFHSKQHISSCAQSLR